MKSVLLVHNRYQNAGGEDQVFEAEAELLQSRGHRVIRYEASNTSITGSNPIGVAVAGIWNRRAYADIQRLVQSEKPYVVHFHNTFPLISPSAYFAVRANGSAVVQTLHNYRLVCSNSYLFRDGHVCEDCVGARFQWRGVLHRCYRGSAAASMGVATIVGVHRLLGTWKQAVDRYIALTDFAKSRLVQAGVASDKICVKSNFTASVVAPGGHAGRYALFVGRLVPEKGVLTLLDAWHEGMPIGLKIVGDGPLFKCRDVAGVEWLGPRSRVAVEEAMRDATVLVFPSLLYETFGLVLIEAMAAGLPSIVSAHGSASELIRDGVTGLHFHPGDASSLRQAVLRAVSDRMLYSTMRDQSRAEYLSKYTPESAYRALLSVYEEARATRDREDYAGGATPNPH